jgi:hypothetical protein
VAGSVLSTIEGVVNIDLRMAMRRSRVSLKKIDDGG